MIQAQNSNSNTNIPALEVESGITSIFLDTEALSSLTGYNLAGTSGTVAPATDEFQVGFNINEESDFSFTTENGFTPTGGSIEQDGTITFNTVNGPSTVGDFSIAFDASRVSEERSGFFVQSGFFTTDTIEPGQILFDISTPEILNITDSTLNIDEADLLISAEFSSFLQTQGFSSTDLTGTDVGDTRIDAIIGVDEPLLGIESGITSIFLDTEALSSLTGYNLAGTNGTVAPATDEFQVGFNIDEESDFSFTTENGFTPTGGSIEQDGTITFNTVNGPSTVGDFSIAFDASRVSEERSGFFVQSGFFTTDTIEPGQILFDISTPEVLNITDSTLNIDEADLLISSEFSSFLQTQGFSSTDLTGTDVGDTRIDAIIGFAEYDCNSGDLM